MDSLRSDHLSCYGYERKTTPFLEDISAQSVVFENAISASGWTRPSFASIFTGTYPSKHGHGLHVEKLPTLMQILRPYGYKTFGMTDNFFVEPLCKGFDDFLYMTKHSVAKMICSKDIRQTFGFLHVVVKNKSISNSQNLLKNVIAKKWLEKSRVREPFFMFMDYSVHWPYNPPEPFFSRFLKGISSKEVVDIRKGAWDLINKGLSRRRVDVLRSLYDGQINYFDSCLKDLVDHLRSLDLFDDTLLIITSDHGDLLGEHGLLLHQFVLYEPLIRVPLILKFPDLFPKGRRYFGLVQTLDILPTLIDYLDINWMDVSQEIQGKSLLKIMNKREEREFTISERSDWSMETSKQKILYLKKRYPNFDWEKYAHEIVSLRTEEYKYIWSSEGKHELYDLKRDPYEINNIISNENEKAGEFESKLSGWKKSFIHPQVSAETEDLKESVKKRLRALGYI